MTPRRLSAKRECEILDILAVEPMTKAALAKRVGISVHQLGLYLSALRSAGVIDHRGNGESWQREWFVRPVMAEEKDNAAQT